MSRFGVLLLIAFLTLPSGQVPAEEIDCGDGLLLAARDHLEIDESSDLRLELAERVRANKLGIEESHVFASSASDAEDTIRTHSSSGNRTEGDVEVDVGPFGGGGDSSFEHEEKREDSRDERHSRSNAAADSWRFYDELKHDLARDSTRALTEEEAMRLVRMAVPREAYQAWTRCLELKHSAIVASYAGLERGLHVAQTDMGETDEGRVVEIRVSWRPEYEGLPAPLISSWSVSGLEPAESHDSFYEGREVSFQGFGRRYQRARRTRPSPAEATVQCRYEEPDRDAIAEAERRRESRLREWAKWNNNCQGFHPKQKNTCIGTFVVPRHKALKEAEAALEEAKARTVERTRSTAVWEVPEDSLRFTKEEGDKLLWKSYGQAAFSIETTMGGQSVSLPEQWEEMRARVDGVRLVRDSTEHAGKPCDWFAPGSVAAGPAQSD